MLRSLMIKPVIGLLRPAGMAKSHFLVYLKTKKADHSLELKS
jgi:hypothetical protein